MQFNTISKDNHIYFWRCSPKNENYNQNIYGIHNYYDTQKNLIKSQSQSLSLLSPSCNFSIFQFMPRLFTISTKKGSANFNSYLLKDTSSVITQFLNDNPQNLQYHLDIDDNENVLGKFEQMYQGEYVVFDEDELPISHKITKLLNLKCCPNFMKPESLKVSEGGSFSYINDISTFGVQIRQESLNNYLKSEAPHNFVISTNKNIYKCNIFGVYSSSVIREILTEDPTIDNYKFDYDDEFNEFQSICDLFNFETVTLTRNNMDSIKEIANDLKIDLILTDIEQYIQTTEKVSQSIDQQQTIIDSIDEIFDLLYNIKSKTVEAVKMKIIHSKWCQTEDNIHELVAFILQVVKTDFLLHDSMIELVIQLDQELDNVLLDFLIKEVFDLSFPKDNFNYFYGSNVNNDFSLILYAFIYNLHKRGLITKDDIVNKLESINFINDELKLWFYPEMLEKKERKTNNVVHRIITKEEIQNQIKDFHDYYFPNNVEQYEKMRESGQPDDKLTIALRTDDVDTVQKILSSKSSNKMIFRNSSSFDKQINCVPFNIFENFLPNGKTNYINYAAAYGSIKCFKYLLLNHYKIDKSTFACAVFGGNNEIIKIVDQKEKEDPSTMILSNDLNDPTNENLSPNVNKKDLSNNFKRIAPSIMKHRYELFDWILEEKFADQKLDDDFLYDLIILSVQNGNAHSLITIIDTGFNFFENIQKVENLIQISAQNGFFLLTKLLYNFLNQKPNFKINNLKISSISLFENASIIDLFRKQLNQDQLESVLFYSIDKKSQSVVKYFFTNLVNDQFKITSRNANIALMTSVNTNGIFDFLIEKIKNIEPSIFQNHIDFQALLNQACHFCNKKETEKIIGFINEYNKKIDYTTSFYKAASSGAIDICQYFIDLKVPINYEQIAAQVSDLGSINEELFSIIFNCASPEAKVNMYECIYQAIQNKNKSLVEYIIKKNYPCKDALILAVQTNDIEMVDLILKYNCQPSFVNQVTSEGTALTVATFKNNLQIVQRLLSIPGIDLNIYNNKNKTPLIIAALNHNIEVLDAILTFYGEDIKNERWQIEAIFRNFFELIYNETSGPIAYNKADDKSKERQIEKFEIVLNHILDVKCIDPNYHYGRGTLLTYACQKNNLNFVQKLLKYDDIDVNSRETKSGDSPLIIAVRNRNIEIVELLINHHKTNINQQNFFGDTALVLALDIEIIDLILNSEKFNPEESCLDYAFFLSDGEIAQKLSTVKSFDVNYRHISVNKIVNQKENQTTLINAVENRNIEKVDLIIHHPSFDKIKSQITEAIKSSINPPMNLNQLQIFTKLMQLVDNDVNITDFKGNSLLYYSVQSSNEEVINYILQCPKFDSNKSDILTSFICSYSFEQQNVFKHQDSISFKIMSLLYDYDKRHEHLIDLTKMLPDGKSFFTVMGKTNDSKEVCEFLLQNGADPCQPDNFGEYPLQHAIQIKSIDSVNVLIDSHKIDLNQKVPINVKEKKNEFRFQSSSIDSVFGEQINYSFDESKFTTYLHLAVKSNVPEILSALLQTHLIDVNVTNYLGDTPLIEAAKVKNYDMIKILFEDENLDYNHMNNEGLDALRTAHSQLTNLSKIIIYNKDDYFDLLTTPSYKGQRVFKTLNDRINKGNESEKDHQKALHSVNLLTKDKKNDPFDKFIPKFPFQISVSDPIGPEVAALKKSFDFNNFGSKTSNTDKFSMPSSTGKVDDTKKLPQFSFTNQSNNTDQSNSTKELNKTSHFSFKTNGSEDFGNSFSFNFTSSKKNANENLNASEFQAKDTKRPPSESQKKFDESFEKHGDKK